MPEQSRRETRPVQLTWVTKIIIIVAALVGASLIATRLVLTGTDVSVLWLPAGIALAAVFIFGYRIWPAIVFASFLVTYFDYYPAQSLDTILLGGVVAAIIEAGTPILGVWLFRRFDKASKFLENPLSIVRLILLAGALPQALNATLAIAGSCLAGVASWSNFGPLWLAWWLSNLSAVLLITPFLLVWTADWNRRIPWSQVWSSFLIFAAVAAGAFLAYTFQLVGGLGSTYFLYMTFPLVVWATFRRGLRGATLSTLICSVISISGFIHQSGFFAIISFGENLFLLQAYLAAMSLTALILASVLSERKQAESALRESEQRFRAIFDSSQDVIFVLDMTTGQILDANQRIVEIFGYSRQEAPELFLKTFCQDEPPYTYEAAVELMDKAAAGSPQFTQWQTRHKDGHLFWVEIHISRATIGEQDRLLLTARDVSERKQVEQALAESQRSMATLLSNLQGMAYSCRNDASWTMEFISSGCLELTGYQPEDLIKNQRLAFIDLICPEDRQVVADGVAQALAINQPYQITYRLLTAEGKTKWVWEQGQGISQNGNENLILEGYITDISALKYAEKALARERDLMQALMDSSPDSIYFKDLKSRYIRLSKSDLEKMGLDEPQQVIGRTDFDFFPPDQAAEFYAGEQQIIQTGQPMVDHEEMESRPGRPAAWVSTTKMPLRDEDGKIVGTVGISRDITSRKMAEEALRSNEQKYRAIIEQFAEGFTLVDSDGCIIEWNQAMVGITGVSQVDAIGTPYWEMVYSLSVPEVQTPELMEHIKAQVFEALETGKSGFLNNPIEIVVLNRAGERKQVQELSFSILTEKGFRLGHIVQDITARKQREQELESISTISAAMRTASSRAEMLPILLDQLMRLIKVDGAAIVMRDPATGEALLEIARGSFINNLMERLPAGAGITGRVLETGQIYVNDDVLNDPLLTVKSRKDFVRTLVAVPLTSQGNPIGVLLVGQNSEFLQAEIRLLTSIADMTANAIHRTTLHEQTEQRLRHLTALRKIDIAISNSLDLKITLDILLDQTISQLQVDAADILLLNPHLHTLEYAAGQGFRSRQSIELTHLQFGEGFAGRTAQERTITSVTHLSHNGTTFPRPEEGFVTYNAVPLIAKGQVKGVLEVFHRTPFQPDTEWLNFLETLAGQAAIAIDNASLFNDLQKLNVGLVQAYDTTLAGWARALEMRDEETEGHSKRVTDLTLRLARELGIRDDSLVHVRRGALLHDIGKMGIPDSILLKPGPLSPDEWVIMRRHPGLAYDWLSDIPFLRPSLDIPYCHHEKWDGSGYPRGLKSEEIPLSARIFAVVDVWDALLSHRPYRAAWTVESTRSYILNQKGRHFDPHVVEVFLSIFGNSDYLKP
jgi:PAS domain S-box-containing protein